MGQMRGFAILRLWWTFQMHRVTATCAFRVYIDFPKRNIRPALVSLEDCIDPFFFLLRKKTSRDRPRQSLRIIVDVKICSFHYCSNLANESRICGVIRSLGETGRVVLRYWNLRDCGGGGFTRTSPSGPRSTPFASTRCTETLEIFGGACMVVCNLTGSKGLTDINCCVSSLPG